MTTLDDINAFTLAQSYGLTPLDDLKYESRTIEGNIKWMGLASKHQECNLLIKYDSRQLKPKA